MMLSKFQIIENFDQNGVSLSKGIFGLPFGEKHSELIIIPVPWEVTVSYSSGTARGPEAILDASYQIDLFQPDIKDAWKMGIHMLPIPEDIALMNTKFRDLAKGYISWLENGSPANESEGFSTVPHQVNEACEKMNFWVYSQAKKHIQDGKLVCLLGGEHSTPLGFLKALSESNHNFGVLQIDAHADLREAFEDFEYSHASIAYNALKLPHITKWVQVGIRDLSEDEFERSKEDIRISTFYDADIKAEVFEGKTWHKTVMQILDQLPDRVYITIDVDGLDPKLCPHTGTPVPGGLEMDQVLYLMKQLVKSGKKIIGFDVVEVAPGPDGDQWDGNVGARLLYRMANLFGVSQGKLVMK